MNIVEAAKSGKRFRRRHDLDWLTLYPGEQLYGVDILADDWEIEEPSVMVTYDSLKEAWNATGLIPGSYPSFEALAKKLGLG